MLLACVWFDHISMLLLIYFLNNFWYNLQISRINEIMENNQFTFVSNKNIVMLELLIIVCLLTFQESLAASSLGEKTIQIFYKWFSSVMFVILGFRGAKEKTHSTHQANTNLNSNFNPQINVNEMDEIVLPDEQILINKLLKYYDPAARPVYNGINFF